MKGEMLKRIDLNLLPYLATGTKFQNNFYMEKFVFEF